MHTALSTSLKKNYLNNGQQELKSISKALEII